MIQVENSILIHRPIDEVFAFCSDPRNTPRWQDKVIETRLISNGPPAAGAQISDVRRFMGHSLSQTMQIVAYEPVHRVVVKTISGPIQFQLTQLFDSVDGSTKVTFLSEGDTGAFFQLASGLIGKQFHKQMAADMARLKAILEKGY